MSYANLLNHKGELVISGVNTANINTRTVTLLDTSVEGAVLSSGIIKNLIDRIEELEKYINAFQQTYILKSVEDGTNVVWTKRTLSG